MYSSAGVFETGALVGAIEGVRSLSLAVFEVCIIVPFLVSTVRKDSEQDSSTLRARREVESILLADHSVPVYLSESPQADTKLVSSCFMKLSVIR